MHQQLNAYYLSNFPLIDVTTFNETLLDFVPTPIGFFGKQKRPCSVQYDQEEQLLIFWPISVLF